MIMIISFLCLSTVNSLRIMSNRLRPVIQTNVRSDENSLRMAVDLGTDVSLAAKKFRLTDYQLNNEPVHLFIKGKTTQKSTKNLKFLLGGKGANLEDMSAMGLAVPPGFTITTEVCNAFHSADKTLSNEVWQLSLEALKKVENEMGRKFGDPKKPLLVSVRSGAAVSMPGMMDTILNLGLNDETVKGLADSFGERFAMDSYRRFLNMFGTVVLGLPHHKFEHAMSELKKLRCVTEDSQLTAQDLGVLVQRYKDVYVECGHNVPLDPYEQLFAAITAVFDSWMCDRAKKYRQAEGIVGLLGTAVNVQAMVFGNMGDTSGTGVCFTRNPNNGNKELYGEYLINAQGEDVVAGIRTPQPILALKDSLPTVYDELLTNIGILEKYYHDMQDIEFTIQEGKLFLLQTRGGKRVGPAAVKIAVDMVKEEIATADQAIMTVRPEHLNQLLHPQFLASDSKEFTSNIIGRGLPASPGAAVGVIVFNSQAAEACFAKGENCVLVRDDTSPEDVGGMWASDGVLTSRGGMTSHAAVVARGWGKPCICGCKEMTIDEVAGTVTIRREGLSPVTLKEGDWISLNGDTGEIIVGKQSLKPPSLDSEETVTFMKWVDDKRKIKVLANADTPADAVEARRNGAQGIGLVRTEHMFFADDRIGAVRRMILAKSPEMRRRALDELLPMQQADFEGILEAMDGLPVTVRLLDPPLHEFLPPVGSVTKSFASELGMTIAECEQEIERMSEVNPMLGLRGCRLGIVLPELVEMQTRALIQAALNVKYKRGLDPQPEVMIPLIGSAKEFTDQYKLIKDTVAAVYKERPYQTVRLKIGTMIEVPRAALTADEVAAAGAEFFSYGTNDLTQMTFGFSRDDVGSYLPTYLKRGLLDEDPFEVIDEVGVGKLITMSTAAGRKVATETFRPFKAGVCGEHGGDPKSVRFFIRSGLDYISCSPFRIPVARLAAAQCVIEDELKGASSSAPAAAIPRLPPTPEDLMDEEKGDDRKDIVISKSYAPRRQ